MSARDAEATSGEDLADPMRPPRVVLSPDAGAAPSEPIVQSLVEHPSGRVAVVSGRLVRTGDRIEGGRVTRITERSVWLSRADGQERELKLLPDVRRKENGR